VLVRTVALENKEAGLAANVVLPGTNGHSANRKSMPDADFSNGFSRKMWPNWCCRFSDMRTRHISGIAVTIEG